MRGNLYLIAEDLGKRKPGDVLKTNESWDQGARTAMVAESLVMDLPPEAVRLRKINSNRSILEQIGH